MSDLISRAEAIEAVRSESAKRLLLGRGDILYILSALPSADRSKGEWDEGIFDVGYFCSNCGETSARTSNFCPNCGSDMRKDETDES